MPIGRHIGHARLDQIIEAARDHVKNFWREFHGGGEAREYILGSAGDLTEEVFGPILHVVRYKAADFTRVLQSIADSGYGLTLSIHSRIDETVDAVVDRLSVGDVYVNRNMIGAVVGVQPFGGHGLSGTGPKAGGPHYLPRLGTEQTVTINTAAAGGNVGLMAGK